MFFIQQNLINTRSKSNRSYLSKAGCNFIYKRCLCVTSYISEWGAVMTKNSKTQAHFFVTEKDILFVSGEFENEEFKICVLSGTKKSYSSL